MVQSIHPAELNASAKAVKARLLLQTDQTDAALQIIQELLEAYPKAPDVLNLYAVSQLSIGDYSKARDAIDKVLTLDAENLTALHNLALLQEALGKTNEAISLLTTLVKKHPHHVPSILALADLLVKQGEQESATAWIRKALAHAPQNQQAKEKLMAQLIRSAHWNEALEVANDMRRTDRLNPDYLLQQATIYIALKNFSAASSNLGVLFGLWREDPEKLLQLSGYQLQAMDVEGARTSLQKAQQLAPKDFAVAAALIRLEIRDAQLDKAQSLVNQWRKQSVPAPQFALIAAELSAAKQDWAQAIGYFNKVLESEPANLAALVGFYQLTLSGHGAEQFQSRAKVALKDSETPVWVRKLLADSYLNSKDWQAARSEYEQLLNTAVFNDHPAILNNLANIYAQSDLDKAIQTAQRALEKGGKSNAALLDTLGWLLAQKGDLVTALAHLREAFTLNAGDPEIRYHLGYVLAKLERPSEAKLHLDAAIKAQASPWSEEAKTLLISLER